MGQAGIGGWLQTEGPEIISQRLTSELFALEVFRPQPKNIYVFGPLETGPGAWLASQVDNEYKILHYDEREKLSNTVLPALCVFSCSSDRVDLYLESADDRRRWLQEGATEFACKVNHACIDLLARVGAKREIPQGASLTQYLAITCDQMRADGYNPDCILFSSQCRDQLIVEGIVEGVGQSPNACFVGKSMTGLDIFCSSDLDPLKAILVSRGSCFSLFIDQEPAFIDAGFTHRMRLRKAFNPIVKDTRAIVVLEGIDRALGSKRKLMRGDVSADLYIQKDRIEELQNCSSSQFDLVRLIAMCREINLCYDAQCYHAVAMLLRAILDHIPPIFGCDTFAQVCAQHGSKSFKEAMNKLDGELRKISDHYLHCQIRKKEMPIGKAQVDFHQLLDFLLSEIVGEMK